MSSLKRIPHISLVTIRSSMASTNPLPGAPACDPSENIPQDLSKSNAADQVKVNETGEPVTVDREAEEEPFTFVVSKKKGRGPATPHSSIKVQPPSSNKKDVGFDVASQLPGWNMRRGGGKVKKNSQRAKMMGSRGHEEEERTIDWGQSMMEERVMTLKQSKFYVAFRDLVRITLLPSCGARNERRQIGSTLSSIQTDKPSTATNNTLEVTPLAAECTSAPDNTIDAETSKDPNSIKDIICYGIGSIENSKNSQFQLALALCIKDILQITGSVSLYDPIMSKYDSELAKHLGLIVLEAKDETAKKPVQRHRTLLYMPHCPKGLYSQVLEFNWSRKQLDKVVILGNRFTRYDESPSFRQQAKQAPFILPALSVAKVSDLPAIKFEDDRAFNDLAFHLFPDQYELPMVDLHDREDDPEFVNVVHNV